MLRAISEFFRRRRYRNFLRRTVGRRLRELSLTGENLELDVKLNNTKNKGELER